MAGKLVVISIDALNAKDFDYIKNLSVFKYFLENGSHVREVQSVYPTLTYCCHTSIITGTYPETHGVYNNEQFNPHRYLNQDWFWYSKDIKVPTLFDVAKKAKLKTASLLWPVMAGNKNIDYNVPEIWSEIGENNTSLFIKYGSLNILPAALKHARKLDGKKQPFVDDFTENMALDLIAKKDIDFFTIHFTELDDMRHRKGVFAQEAYEILDKINTRLETLMEAFAKKGQLANTNFILLGDHGGNDFTKIVYLNKLFLDEGLIEVDDDMDITNWDAFANDAGGSVQIHLRTPSDSDIYKSVYERLSKLLLMPGTPFSALFTREEVSKSMGLMGDFSFVMEAKDGYIFRNEIEKDWIMEASEIEGAYKSDHGFLPTHPNLKTMLLAKGPDISHGVTIQKATLPDIGPTLATLLNLTLPTTQGQIIKDLLKKEGQQSAV